MRLPEFSEALGVVDVELSAAGVRLQSAQQVPPLSADAALYSALVAGVAGYVRKNKFPGVLLGLSGGMDSALVLCIAVDALGAERVQTVMMPSPYTAQMSLDDARAMARHFGCRYDEIPIAPAMQTFTGMLDPLLAGRPMGLTHENLQSRIRANLLMALSNQSGALVLTTGNGVTCFTLDREMGSWKLTERNVQIWQEFQQNLVGGVGRKPEAPAGGTGKDRGDKPRGR